MKTNVNIEKNVVKFTIELTNKDYKKILDELVDEKIKTVEVDGFRKGKMPKTMFMKKYGYGAILPDAIDKVINEGIDEMMNEYHFEIISNFDIDWDNLQAKPEDDFKCSGSVEIMPQIELKGYKEAHKEVKKPEAKVTKKAIKETIDSLLEDKAIMEIVETPAKEGDTVVIDFVGSVDGKEFAGGSSENYPLVLGSGTFIPGFEDQLIGAKPEDEIDVVVTFPENYPEEALANKEAVFKTKVHEVKTKKVPKLTDELAKEIRQYEVETKAELEEAVEKDLLARKQEEINVEYGNKVFEKIRKDNKLEIPKKAIQAQVEAQIDQIRNNLKAQGMDLDTLLQMTQSSIEDLEKNIASEAKERLRNSMIIKAVIRQEKLKATNEDLNEHIKNIAKAQNKTQKEIKEQIKEAGIEEQLKEELVVDKAIKLILGE